MGESPTLLDFGSLASFYSNLDIIDPNNHLSVMRPLVFSADQAKTAC